MRSIKAGAFTVRRAVSGPKFSAQANVLKLTLGYLSQRRDECTPQTGILGLCVFVCVSRFVGFGTRNAQIRYIDNIHASATRTHVRNVGRIDDDDALRCQKSGCSFH